MSRHRYTHVTTLIAARLTLITLASVALACSPDHPTGTDLRESPHAPSLAKAPGTPTVNSATPDTGSQGTTLDVRVFGCGFTAGATATWQLNGVASPAKIRTNTTSVVSATELVANITIADSADVASWDIQVALAGGKKGIGTELFAVKAKVPPPQQGTGLSPSGARWVFGTLGTTVDANGGVTTHPAALVGDGRDVNGTLMGGTPTIDPFVGTSSGDYQDLLCGPGLRIYWWNSLAASGDGTFDPSLQAPITCPQRLHTVTLGSVQFSGTWFMYLWRIMQIPLGESRRQVLRIRLDQPNCTRLSIGTQASETDFTATSGGVRVTRVAGTAPGTHVFADYPGYVPGEWLVETVDGRATCENQKGQRWTAGASYTGVYFRIHVTEIPPSP